MLLSLYLINRKKSCVKNYAKKKKIKKINTMRQRALKMLSIMYFVLCTNCNTRHVLERQIDLRVPNRTEQTCPVRYKNSSTLSLHH